MANTLRNIYVYIYIYINAFESIIISFITWQTPGCKDIKASESIILNSRRRLTIHESEHAVIIFGSRL